MPPKKGKGKLPLFCGDVERVIPIYAMEAKDDRKQYVDQIKIIVAYKAAPADSDSDTS